MASNGNGALSRVRALVLGRVAEWLELEGEPYMGRRVWVEIHVENGLTIIVPYGGERPPPCDGQACQAPPRNGLVQLGPTQEQGESARRDEPERPAGVAVDARWLSPTEEQAIEVLESSRFLSSDQVATALDVADKRSLCVLLTNLAARGVIESARGQGYRRRKLP